MMQKDILDLVKGLPIEIVQIILSYSYNCQSTEICDDIRSFLDTKKRICDTFYLRYKDILVHEECADMLWLTSDVMMYMNKNHASFHGYEDKFYEITTRHFLLKKKDRAIINKIFHRLYKKPIFSQFHILWGLLLPAEREHFIQIQSRIRY
jgi:hypothetical protein